MKYLINALEWLFWQTRFVIFIGVLSGILTTLVLVILGTIDAYDFFATFYKSFGSKKGFTGMGSTALLKGLKMVELFLAATLTMFFSFGIFQVFIHRISRFENDPEAAKGLIVTNIEQFKDKFLKLIHIILITTFFKYTLTVKFSNETDLLYLSGSIFLVAASMYLASKK
ncbi:MAG: YqhA family protein [Leptospirales bacterium]